MQVVYDTGSDWLTVKGVDCSICDGNLYDWHLSDGFEFLEMKHSMELNYGSAQFKGLRANDSVCLPADPKGKESSVCLDSFEFFLINE